MPRVLTLEEAADPYRVERWFLIREKATGKVARMVPDPTFRPVGEYK